MYFDIGIMWIRDVANEVENIGCRNVVMTSERKEEKQTEGKAKKTHQVTRNLIQKITFPHSAARESDKHCIYINKKNN